MEHNPSSLHNLPEMYDQYVFNQMRSPSFDDDDLFSDTFHQTGGSLCSKGESSDQISSSTVTTVAAADNNDFPSSSLFFKNNPKQPEASAFTLSFDNSTIIPITNSSPPGRTRSTRNTQPRNKSRSSSDVLRHIVAERKRRRDLTQKFIALAATIPGLKKMDKVTVLCEAIDYVKRLQERVRELESVEGKRKTNGGGGTAVRREKNSMELCWCRRRAQEAVVQLPEMEAKVSENQVLIRIHCERRSDMMLKMAEILEYVNLSVLSCSSLAFGNSAFSITIVAQMKEKYNMKVNDLIKYLRQHLFKSNDVR
ncbi:hypothetical protein QN277_024365 [Acacia crassicarpa]|uniref:BHLH domain-containing protein n=1 Tax=Acacia crassicarpa TaxID=499986 RepID=A0AAE1MK32_9FABA|nr:hypothetical protein QN277_024365 [Acacia crassicarpa]